MGKLNKNLANCTPEEFLVQTNRVRKAAEKWLKVTDIMNIRKEVPKLEIPRDASQEEVDRILREHKEAVSKQARANLSKIFDMVAEEHPKETVELLALLNFVDPAKANDYRITDYLENITAIIEDEAVMSFFTSLMRLEQSGILGA